MNKFQFQFKGDDTGPVRETWGEAAWDAVNAGVATWQMVGHRLYLDDKQAVIKKVRGISNESS